MPPQNGGVNPPLHFPGTLAHGFLRDDAPFTACRKRVIRAVIPRSAVTRNLALKSHSEILRSVRHRVPAEDNL
jgi:hypothetical protein